MEGLKSHFQNNIMATGKEMEKGNFRLGHLKNIEIQEIKGLISSKLIRAQKLNIETFIDIVEPISKINMGIIDFCRVNKDYIKEVDKINRIVYMTNGQECLVSTRGIKELLK